MSKDTTGINSAFHPSQASGLVLCTCPCGEELGMCDPSDMPTCGDEDCDEYLERHPEWYRKQD